MIELQKLPLQQNGAGVFASEQQFTVAEPKHHVQLLAYFPDFSQAKNRHHRKRFLAFDRNGKKYRLAVAAYQCVTAGGKNVAELPFFQQLCRRSRMLPPAVYGTHGRGLLRQFIFFSGDQTATRGISKLTVIYGFPDGVTNATSFT